MIVSMLLIQKKTVNENVGFAWSRKNDNEIVPNVWMFCLEKKKIGCHTKKGTASISGTSDFVDVKS